jgi:hypothetical protein
MTARPKASKTAFSVCESGHGGASVSMFTLYLLDKAFVMVFA